MYIVSATSMLLLTKPKDNKKLIANVLQMFWQLFFMQGHVYSFKMGFLIFLSLINLKLPHEERTIYHDNMNMATPYLEVYICLMKE